MFITATVERFIGAWDSMRYPGKATILLQEKNYHKVHISIFFQKVHIQQRDGFI